jgi:cell division septation protein DedD
VSRGRFGLLLAVLVGVVASVTCIVVLALIDDDPGGNQAATTTTSTSTTTSTTAPGGLATPAFVAIVSSEADEPTARAMVDELTERGYDSAVLHSDDHTSLEPGFWVAYVGPFADVAAAQTATDQLIGDGYTAAYPRCVGTAEQCA